MHKRKIPQQSIDTISPNDYGRQEPQIETTSIISRVIKDVDDEDFDAISSNGRLNGHSKSDPYKIKNVAYTLITGASSGIGKALALECASRGMNILLVALPGDELHSLEKQIG